MIDEKKKVGLVDAIISGDVGRWIIGNINNPQEFRFEKEEGARVGRFSAIVTVEHNRGLNTR